ncbi:MAG: curli production assembly/transport component CsgF [Runella sp.]
MKKTALVILLITSISYVSHSQGFVYRPVNPNFGGNTFNYAWLLSSAQAQDTFKDPNAPAPSMGRVVDPVADFATSLTRQTLSQLSRQLSQNQFGENGLEPGTYQFGDLSINITPGAEGLVVRITDGRGGETIVTVPYF